MEKEVEYEAIDLVVAATGKIWQNAKYNYYTW